MKKRKKKTKKIFKTIIGIFLLITAICFGIYGYFRYKKEKEEDLEALNIYNDIEDNVLYVDTDVNDLKINWELLKDYNVVGWIIAGKNISFPIVRYENNSYYLYRLYDGTYNANGSIFMDCSNDGNFTDLNTVIYGHKVRGSAMFGPLINLLEYSDENIKQFDIYLPDGTKHVYDIFSVAKVKADGYAYVYKFGTLENFRGYKEQLRDNSQYDMDIELTDSKTVLLSTCDSGSAYGNRIVVIGQETEVRKVQEAASWYKKRDCMEVNSKSARCILKNNGYYILYKDKAIRCLKENADDMLSDKSKTIISLVEYTETEDFLEYEELNGEIKTYQILDIYSYEIK